MYSVLAQNLPQAGDFLFYHLIHEFLADEIRTFGIELMGRTMAWIGSIALVLLTLWVMLQGYLIAIGQSRESLTMLVNQMLKATLIVSIATAMSVGGTNLYDFLTRDLNAEIHQVVTGRNGTPEQAIDKNLAYMQMAMSGIDALSTEDDQALADQKNRAQFFAGLGTAGPAMSAAAMLLLFEVALALFIGFGPIFIICLLFRSTQPLFQKWLFYGVGTLFSMAMLSFVTHLSMRMVSAVAQAFWGARFTAVLTGMNIDEGITSQALQQGGLGLLLTVLIISTPPMAAAFFQGSVGHFMTHNGFQGQAPFRNPSIQRMT